MGFSRSLKCMCFVLAASALLPAALAKDKGPALPLYVLQARTVAVIIDTDSHDVPAVDEFRKALKAAAKQASQQKKP